MAVTLNTALIPAFERRLLNADRLRECAPPRRSSSELREQAPGFLFLALGQKIPGLPEGRGLRWIPEALEVSGLTRQQSTRFQRRRKSRRALSDQADRGG